MLKKLMFLIIIFNIFFLVDNVSAKNINSVDLDRTEFITNIYADVNSSYWGEYYSNYQNALDYFDIDSLDKNKYSYALILNSSYNSGSKPYYVYFHYWLKSSNNYLKFEASHDAYNNKYSFTLSDNTSNNVYTKAYDLKNNIYISNPNNYFYGYLSSFNGSDYSFNEYATLTSNCKIIYTSEDIKYCLIDNFSNNLLSFRLIENNEVKETFSIGDNIFNADTGLNINNIPSYGFHETIDGSSVGKVQINFKIPENLNYRDTYLFDLDVNSVSMLANDYSPKLYLKYGNIFDDNLITQIDVFTNYEEFEDSETLRTYTRYFGNFGADMIYNNTYDFITLTLDFSDYINNYALNFTSTLDFDVQYTSREDEEQYYHTIDMTNKYSLYLIPKVINTDIYTSINLYGNYDLYSIKDYTNSKSECSYLKNLDISFSNIFSFLDYNNALKFINLNYTTDNNSTISFDSRLFDYTIQNTENENVKISNSNTGEIVNSNVIDTIVTEKKLEELEKDDSSSIFYKPIKFITNKFPILEQAINIYNLYSSYDYQETKPDFPKISLSFMGIDKEFETIDLSFYEQYRDLIFSYSKLTMALLTLLKVVKNVKNSFGGGN